VADAEVLGITPDDLDEHVRRHVESVLCGTTIDKLDAMYLVPHVPPLRIAFRIALDYDDQVACHSRDARRE
jgi:hypothetical protein